MVEETNKNTTELKKLSMDKIFCYVAMALFIALPVGEIINEILVKNKVKFGKTYLYPSYLQSSFSYKRLLYRAERKFR